MLLYANIIFNRLLEKKFKFSDIMSSYYIFVKSDWKNLFFLRIYRRKKICLHNIYQNQITESVYLIPKKKNYCP